MIKKLTIQNFKSLRSVSIDLERFTVFVGANGSGKTSVLDAIDSSVFAARGVLRNRKSKTILGLERFYTRGSTGDLIIECQTDGGEFACVMTPPEDNQEVVSDPPLGSRWSWKCTPSDITALGNSILEIGTTQLLKFNPGRLSQATYSERAVPRLGSDGNGLPSTLAYMALNDPDNFAKLTADMQKLIPKFRRIRFTRKSVEKFVSEEVTIGDDSLTRRQSRQYQGDALLFDFENANNLAADMVSEGTLMLLGLITAIRTGPVQSTLLLDDIEHGLHPLAQKSLIELIQHLLEAFPNLQLLATSHSPYLVNYLEPEQVRIMATADDGSSRCGKLTDHPKFRRWTEEMFPGELWSVFGEKWLVEQEAS